MPRKRRTPHRRTYGDKHITALDWPDFFGVFGGADGNTDMIAAKAAWEVLRDRVIERREQLLLGEMNGTLRRRTLQLRPWAWWAFESFEKRNRDMSEAEQLAGMNALTDFDREAIERLAPVTH